MASDKTTSLCALTASQAAAKIHAGEISSAELTAACLEKIEKRDRDILAWAHVDRNFAMEQANHADAARATGIACGPLHGVPIAVKDIIDTADFPTENGSPIFSGRQPGKDAACVSALRQAGAVIIGKTVTTELALLTPAVTKNPINTGHTPGGSSAGSAAAVADGHVPAALGTQTAGSVLRPASYCGLYGFKPTLGLVPRSGILMQSHTLDTVGVLARAIEDIGLLTDAISFFDPDDAASFPRSHGSLRKIAAQDPPVAPLFAFVKTPAWGQADPALHDAYAELVNELGDACEEIEIENLAAVIEWHRITHLVENAGYYGPLQDKASGQLSEGLNARLTEGTAIPVRDYLDAVTARDTAAAQIEKIFARYTAILTPPATGPAPEGLSITGSPIFNGLWTYLGMPAISVPLLEVDAMPLGVQLVGPRRDDGRLLRTARWLVRHLDQPISA